MSIEKIDVLLKQLTEVSGTENRYAILKGNSVVGWASAGSEKSALEMWATDQEITTQGLRAELLDTDKILDSLDAIKVGHADRAMLGAVGEVVKNCDRWLEEQGVVLDYDIENKLDKKVLKAIEENIGKLLKGWRR